MPWAQQFLDSKWVTLFHIAPASNTPPYNFPQHTLRHSIINNHSPKCIHPTSILPTSNTIQLITPLGSTKPISEVTRLISHASSRSSPTFGHSRPQERRGTIRAFACIMHVGTALSPSLLLTSLYTTQGENERLDTCQHTTYWALS